MYNKILNLLMTNQLNPMTSDTMDFKWLIPVGVVALILIVLLIVVGKKRK